MLLISSMLTILKYRQVINEVVPCRYRDRFSKHVCNNPKRNFELLRDQLSAGHDWKQHTYTLTYTFQGLFHLIVCLLVLNCWDNGPWIISNRVAASSFKLLYFPRVTKLKEYIILCNCQSPDFSLCFIFMTVSFVFWGLYCNYIGTKLFQCSTVILFMIEKMCYLC